MNMQSPLPIRTVSERLTFDFREACGSLNPDQRRVLCEFLKSSDITDSNKGGYSGFPYTQILGCAFIEAALIATGQNELGDNMVNPYRLLTDQFEENPTLGAPPSREEWRDAIGPYIRQFVSEGIS